MVKKSSKKSIKKPINKSLYADWHPEKSLKGTGFKDEETAIKTIGLIKNRDKSYQFNVVNTMYNRAKYHPYQTLDMRKAMKVFKRWLQDNA